MIRLPELSPNQKKLTRTILNERAFYPVTFRVNEVANSTNFPTTDWTGLYRYKTFTWTPSYATFILGVSFSGTIYNFVNNSGAAPVVGLVVSYNATLPVSGGPATQVDNGNFVYYKTFYAFPQTGASGRTFNDYRDFQPYTYYIPANTSIYIFFLQSISVDTYNVLANATFHTQFMNIQS